MITITKLEKAIHLKFVVNHLEIEDVSSGCGESYSVLLVSDDFQNKSTLQRHRMINEALKEEISQMHAFSQKTYTPAQYEEYLARQKKEAE
ncbi:bola-like protein [Macrolepiota fuliginosa MF-IS2]|uniref:Bola-like protein n=1 Tax=Macrolepiota fuliginosa MF-IS2 TaxID=1400762 RepID=A0A9P6C0F8_9AGAR|nr:bola-like protein [Macrolepiota fuliginosa MF-IS2]